MHGSFVYLDEKTIRLYIKEYGRKLDGKDYELAAAVILKGFFEKENNIKCAIGIKLNPRYYKLYQSNTKPLTLAEAKNLIELHNDENDVVDVAISPINSLRGNKSAAWIFQLKRFGSFQTEKDTEGLIKFLTKIQKSYAKTNTILVIFFDGHKGISIIKAHEHIKKTDFPFSRVMFINTNKNDKNIWKINIGEMWPTCGYNEYDPYDLIENLSSL